MVSQYSHPDLDARARSLNPRVKRWLGRREGSAKRRYVCYLCGGMIIDTESSRHFPTKHAQEAIMSHRAMHLEE